MNDIIIGIDLGTTNSEAAVCIDGKIEIIPMADGSLMLPSVVGISPEGKLIVGREARNQLALFPDHTVRSIKRKMGSGETVRLGDRDYLPQEISAMILTTLKNAAEKHLGKPVSKAVITVPAQFNDAQRNATREAGRIAGLEVLRIINEPTAACLAYENDNAKTKKTLLAFDLGGGTFDVSLVSIEGDVTEVIASCGDNRLGGDDFDQAIAERLQAELLDKHHAPLDRIAEYRLVKAAEQAKMQLSEFAFAQIIESNLAGKNGESLSLERELSRQEFDELLKPFVAKTVLAVRRCLSDAGVKADAVDDIILVGGSTRSSVFQDMIEREFNRRPHANIQPDLAVAYGAGMMAARLMGDQQHRILVDITPYTFGISCLGDLNGQYCPYLFASIIKAGSALPVSREELFLTSYDNQEAIEINVFQGENPDARKNTLIGTFRIEDLSKQPAGSKIVMSMKLDLDGLLRCTASEKITGKRKDIVITNALAKLTDDELALSRKRVAKLFENQEPWNNRNDELADDNDDDDENPLAGILGDQNDDDDGGGHEAAEDDLDMLSTLTQLTIRLQKASPKMDREDLAEADALIHKLKAALNSGDTKAFRANCQELDDLLFYAES